MFYNSYLFNFSEKKNRGTVSGLGFALGNFLGSSELDLMKVEIVSGASSAFFGPNAFNGVISMNTKSPFLFDFF